MSENIGGTDHQSAPQDYAELFRLYYPYVCNLVRRAGIDENNKEDVASEILLKFMDHDCLAQFDPTRTFTYNGRTHRAKFGTFLSRFVAAYVRGHKDRQDVQAKREPLYCDQNLSTGTETERWVTVYGPTEGDISEAVLDLVTFQEIVNEWKRHLATVPKRFDKDTADLPAILDSIAAQVLDKGVWDVPSMCAQFGNGVTRMFEQIWFLRDSLADHTGRPRQAKRPRVVKKAAA